MLDANYIRDRAEGAGLIAEELHREIIRAMVDRYMARMGRGESFLTATDKWQLQVLSDAGYLMKDIQTEIAAKTGQELTEIAKVFEDAAIVNLQWDDGVYRAAGLEPMPLRQSPNLMRLVQRGYDKTAGEWRNFTGTLADEAQRTFIRECDTAYHLVTSGAMGYSQAVVQAVERTARDGVIVRYPSGHRDTVETATLRAVRTGTGQACGEITLARMRELDYDTVLVSSHLGARTGSGMDDWTNHSFWQGKFYSLSGEDDRFPRFDVCGWGYVDGIYGANCRHSIGPGDGEHNPFAHIDSEENRLREERDARMRLLERRIRASRREVLALQEAVEKAPDDAVKAEAEAAHRRKAKVLMRQEKEYDDFCEENKTRKLYDRLQVAQYGAKQARAAEKAAETGNVLKNEGNLSRTAGNAPQKAGNVLKTAGKEKPAEQENPPQVAEREPEPVPLTESTKTGIIDEKGQQEEKPDVHTVGRIDIEKYKCVTEGIQTDEVIITDERIAHIQEEHPNDFERYSKHIAEMVEDPQYILQDPDPYTAVILQEFSEEGERFRLIMKLAVKTDGWKKNSIITFLKISEKKFKKYLRNKNILYRKE